MPSTDTNAKQIARLTASHIGVGDGSASARGSEIDVVTDQTHFRQTDQAHTSILATHSPHPSRILANLQDHGSSSGEK
jgi:hypothetical protein